MPSFANAKRFYIFISLITISGWGWLLFYNNRPHNGTVCIIKNISGSPCPSCGTTKSSIAILKGDWSTAINNNILGFLAIAVLTITPIWLVIDVIFKQKSLYNYYNKTETKLKEKKVYLFTLLLLITINWIWNLFKTM